MTDHTMERYLKSIGKGFFAEYYEKLADLSVPNQKVASLAQREKGYTTASQRVSTARSIIKADRGEDALRACLASRR